MPHHSPTIVGAIFAASALCLAGPAAGDDVVYLKPEGFAGTPGRVTGQIADYTGRGVTLKSTTGRERTIPIERIDRVQTEQSAEHQAADELFAERDFQGALAQYRLALAASREPRDWVRRRILARIVWCLRNLDQPDQAGEYFLILFARDPTTPDFDSIPLAWTDAPRPPAVVEKARAWLASGESSPAVLLGASQLLETPRREHALEALDILTHDPDPRVAFLAGAQLWRATAARATFDQLRAAQAATEAADARLRAGAYFLLGSALARRVPEVAAIALMKLPILYPREYQLSAAAMLTAGECLEKSHRPQQAAGLYRELSARYGDTSAAAEANRRLQALAPSGAARDN